MQAMLLLSHSTFKPFNLFVTNAGHVAMRGGEGLLDLVDFLLKHGPNLSMNKVKHEPHG